MIGNVSYYVLTLDTLNELEARFTLDREDVPYVSLVLPRSGWTELQAPTQVRVRVEVSAQLPAEAAAAPSTLDHEYRHFESGVRLAQHLQAQHGYSSSDQLESLEQTHKQLHLSALPKEELPVKTPLTSHGHDIPGVTTAGVMPEGVTVMRCGGVRLCRTCRREADYYTVQS